MDVMITKENTARLYTEEEIKKLLKQCWEASYDYTEQVFRINSGLSNFDKPTYLNKNEWINKKISEL